MTEPGAIGSTPATPRPARRPELLVMWGNTAWDGHRLGAQFLAEALAAHHEVLYVDPPTSVVRRLRSTASPAGAFRARLEQVADGIHRLRPVGPPGIRRPLVRRLTSVTARRALRHAVDELGRPVRAVVSGYLDVQPFGACGERWRICRISDDFSTGTELGLRVRHLARAQARIAAHADALVCVSEPLVAAWRAQGYDPVLVPNGCDVRRLSGGRSAPRPAAVDLPAPIVGFVGLLSNRVDLALLEAVVDAGRSLLLVGSLRAETDRDRLDRLLARPGVQWLGERPYDEIPALLATMSVGLLPYRDTAFNRASFPLKLLEYLGAGLAPVATDLPAVRWLHTDLVRIADGPAAFRAAVDDALRHADDPGERAARHALAARHDWSRRAEDYVALLDRLDATAPAAAGGSQSAGP